MTSIRENKKEGDTATMKKKKPLEERIQDYNERKSMLGEDDYISIMTVSYICDAYNEKGEYDKAFEYTKKTYEFCLKNYGVNDFMTSHWLDKLVACYERAGDRESIDSVVDEYYRIREETLEIEIPDLTDDDILF